MMNRTGLLVALLTMCLTSLQAETTTSSRWVRPCESSAGEPLWGHRDGLQVGLPSEGGPYGLLYLYHQGVVGKAGHPLNFIAIEPVVGRARGLSELEPSQLDRRKGKRFWSADHPDATPRDPNQAACGTITRHGTTETLQVFIMAEPFDNGARVHLRLTFQSDRPNELGLETFATSGSAPMAHCILTATMGNYARLRRLHLKENVVTSHELWPDYRERDFAPHRHFPLSRLHRDPEGEVIVGATPDEENPAAAKAPGHWNYTGSPAVQYWRLPAGEVVPETIARVNGRYTYWKSRRPIPGGISFENFELERPFRPGEAAVYGVTTGSVEQLFRR